MVRMGGILCGAVLAVAMAAGTWAAEEAGGAPAELAVADPVLTAVERVPRATLLANQVDRLIDRVVALNENHGWRWSEAGALIANLEEAFIDLDNGKFTKAAHQISDFSDRITAYVDKGALPEDAGTPLIEAAGGILGRIEALERTERLEPLATP